MKTSILARVKPVAQNLYRDPESGAYYGIKKIAGKRKVKSFRMGEGAKAPPITDRRTAERMLNAWRDDLDAHDQSAADLKFGALLDKFLRAREGKADGTKITEEGIANTLRRTFEPGMSAPVRSIRTSDLLNWLTAQKVAREWGGNYYNRCRYFLRQLFELAEADGVITDATNPFKKKFIRLSKVEKRRRYIPTLEQFEAIIASVRAQKDYAQREQSADFLAFLGLAGIGQAEASTLRREDINLATGKISYVRMKTQRPFQTPIYWWLAPLVKKLLAQPIAMDGRVFHMRSGKKGLTAACKRLDKAARAAGGDGFPHFTQRNLRAMCIKRLYDTRVPVKRIALWQGHNDGGKLIQQIYTEVFCDSDAAAEAADLALVQAAKFERIAA